MLRSDQTRDAEFYSKVFQKTIELIVSDMMVKGHLVNELTRAQSILKQLKTLLSQKIEIRQVYQQLVSFNKLGNNHLLSKMLQFAVKSFSRESFDREFEDNYHNLLELFSTAIPKDTIHNLWIIKPANLSRGRNIKMCSSLSEIRSLTDDGKFKSMNSQWIIQKYIENPLLITGRKFDIRLYVLITSMNPFTLWFYREYYIRLSPLKYSTDDKNTASIHLTNFSVSKYVAVSEDEVYKERMLSRSQFREYLSQTVSLNAGDLLEVRIKSLLKKMFAGAPALISDRPNTFEMLGVDILIDEDLIPWVLEVNASPSMEMGTSVTTQVITRVSEDLIKVVIDENLGNKNPTQTEIGRFELLMKYPKNDYEDLSLEITGLGIKGQHIADLSLI